MKLNHLNLTITASLIAPFGRYPMKKPIRFILAPAFPVLLALCTNTVSETSVQAAEREAPAKALAEWLKRQGYVAIPMVLDKAGWLDVKVEVEGRPTSQTAHQGSRRKDFGSRRNAYYRTDEDHQTYCRHTQFSGGFLCCGLRTRKHRPEGLRRTSYGWGTRREFFGLLVSDP